MIRFGMVVAAMALWSGQALAWTGTVEWPTFYRAGPDHQYGVLDELQRGQKFEVMSCDGDWCHARDATGTGYIPRGALAATTPMPGTTPQATDCVDSRMADSSREGEPFRFCVQKPGG